MTEEKKKKPSCRPNPAINKKISYKKGGNRKKISHHNQRRTKQIINRRISKSKLFRSGLPSKEDYIRFYFGKRFEILDGKQIVKLAKDYEKKFNKICVDNATNIKNLILTEYGKIRGLKTVALRSIFSFDLGTKIRKVEKRENLALSKNTLNRIKKEIIKYRNTQKTLVDVHQEGYDKIFTFINEHLEFLEYIESKKTGRFKISNIKTVGSSCRLELRSWLIVNLRYTFPRKCGIPLDNNLNFLKSN